MNKGLERSVSQNSNTSKQKRSLEGRKKSIKKEPILSALTQEVKKSDDVFNFKL